jgi:hypothetical protein
MTRDRLVAVPAQQSLEDLQFSWRELSGSCPCIRSTLPAMAFLGAQIESASDRSEESLLLIGLLDKIDGAKLHCLHRRCQIAMAGHHDRGDCYAALRQLRHRAEPIKPGHAQVQQNAPAFQIALQQKLLTACVDFGRVPAAGEEIACGGANMRVVIDDMD